MLRLLLGRHRLSKLSIDPSQSSLNYAQLLLGKSSLTGLAGLSGSLRLLLLELRLPKRCKQTGLAAKLLLPRLLRLLRLLLRLPEFSGLGDGRLRLLEGTWSANCIGKSSWLLRLRLLLLLSWLKLALGLLRSQAISEASLCQVGHESIALATTR